MSLEKKIIFQIANADAELMKSVDQWIRELYSTATLYSATNDIEAMQKMRNVPPNVLITIIDAAKSSGIDLVTTLIRDKNLSATAVLILSDVPDEEFLIDDIVKGRVHFLPPPFQKEAFAAAMGRVLSKMGGIALTFSVKTLKAKEILFREGDTAGSAFLVKMGKLKAYKESGGKPELLGDIGIGEFVGEMALLNRENRSATVEVVEDCELIEVPMGSLDALVFSKPAWSKALVKTLAKRLKTANQKN